MKIKQRCSIATIVFLMLWLSGCANSSPSGQAATSAPAPTSPAAPTSAPAPTSPAAPTSAAHDHTAEPVATAPVAGPSAALNPNCAFEPIDLEKYGGAAFSNPTVVSSQNGVLRTTLDVRYGNNTIAGCPVTLRSYNGKLVGDTWRVKPGDTLDITLTNNLPVGDTDPNSTSIYNVTNLHTHGLHVSPTGSEQEGWSDNVLLRIWPKGTPPITASVDHMGMIDVIGEAHYKIKIPPTHPSGTFWYHAHAHGSTAAQASSGMGGALIIEGGLDDVPEISAAKGSEKIFVFQQNVYSATGTIEQPGYSNFGPCTWEPTYREHMINGQLYPTITMAAGEMQRWRFIHAGVRETLSLELRGPEAITTSKLLVPLTLPTTTLNEIAVDGLALGKSVPWQQITLNPGYRSDALVKVDQPGTYYLIDGLSSDNALTCPGTVEQPSMLAKVIVTGDRNDMPLPTALGQYKWTQADLVRIDPTQAQGSEQFLVPTRGITNVQQMDFTVAAHPALNPTLGFNPPAVFLASDHSFDADNGRKLKLGNIELWILTTKPDSLYYAHPFHIHINPFQTWRLGPDGNPDLVWRDTLLVPQGQTQYIYTQYLDYKGAFVYHCHILDHEDQGMMEKVEVVD